MTYVRTPRSRRLVTNAAVASRSRQPRRNTDDDEQLVKVQRHRAGSLMPSLGL
jgi:hypothetical protein